MFGKVLLFFLSPSSGVKDDWRTVEGFLFIRTLPGKLSGYQNKRVLVVLKAKWIQLCLTLKQVTLISGRSLGNLCEENHGII